MTQTNIVFVYTEKQDFEHPLEITMEVPIRGIDEMCEYFQRFLAAAGYIFDEGEQIKPVKKAPESYYPGCGGDILTFNDDGSPFCYDFGDNNSPFFGGMMMYGATGDDTITFNPKSSV